MYDLFKFSVSEHLPAEIVIRSHRMRIEILDTMFSRLLITVFQTLCQHRTVYDMLTAEIQNCFKFINILVLSD
jgi:stress-induced morphogen